MPIGKDSIKTRVAKVAAEEPKAETLAEVKPAPKKPATRKPAAPKAPKAEAPAVEAPVAETPVVDTAVLANVSPETVAAVIGHDEKKPSDKVKIGQKMPTYLL